MRNPVFVTIKEKSNEYKFKVYPLSATEAEDLLIRICLLSGKNLDSDLMGLDGKDLIKALLSCSHKEAKGLLDELLFCCYKLDGNVEKQITYSDLDGCFDNPLSITKLRIESIKVNFGFFLDGSLQDFLTNLNL